MPELLINPSCTKRFNLNWHHFQRKNIDFSLTNILICMFMSFEPLSVLGTQEKKWKWAVMIDEGGLWDLF